MRGHRVHRVNLNLGDRLCWRLPAIDFRGRFEDWPRFVGEMLDDRGITDLVLLGDRRPYHIAAITAADARGIASFVTDLGYVRPDWLTLERDGMTSRSRFPREPAAIRALAEAFPEPDLAPRFATPFRILALHDIAYNVATALGRPLYPHYRRHGIYHPFAEYAGWGRNAPRRWAARRAIAAAKARLAAQPGTYFRELYT
jgi:capsular polysaccharide export protein